MFRALKPAWPINFMPAAAIIPNITTAAPPNTAEGNAATNAANFGTKPARIKKTAPIETTWRLITFV